MHKVIKDMIEVVLIVGAILLALFLYSGVFPSMVVVESYSMLEDHSTFAQIKQISPADIILIRSTDKGGVITYEDGKGIGYKKFGDYGDVIVYRKFGNEETTPVIHRAIRWVEKGEMVENGGRSWIAEHSGYLTKGDNDTSNPKFDQNCGIAYQSPVKEEWIVGKSEFEIPWLGMLSLIVREPGSALEAPFETKIMFAVIISVIILLSFLDEIIKRMKKR